MLADMAWICETTRPLMTADRAPTRPSPTRSSRLRALITSERPGADTSIMPKKEDTPSATDDHPGDARTSPRQARQGRSWHVERIETTPMTPAEHARAVTALATLINEWTADKSRDEQT